MQNARNNFMLLIFMFMFICRLSKKKKNCKELELGMLEFHITRNSSLPSLSTTFFFIVQIPSQQCHGGMKLGTRVY